MEKKNIAGRMSFYFIIAMSFLSFYRQIARENCSSDKSLTQTNTNQALGL
jgi:hypothetical protein